MAFVVDLRSKNEIGICSGTIIAPNLVLTAGHCGIDMNTGEPLQASDYRVVTGAVNWTSPERQLSHVTRVLVYPHFSISGHRWGWGDAALLVLSTATTAPPIRLATFADAARLHATTHALVAGWGEVRYAQKHPTTRLMWAAVGVKSERSCQRELPVVYFPKGQTCAIHRFVSTDCSGDSGGPLLAAEPEGDGLIEIGIVHSGFESHGHCSNAAPIIFTRADLISGWARRWITALDPQSPSPHGTEPTVQPLANPLAEAYTRRTLRAAFGIRFRRRYGYRVLCHPLGPIKQRCEVSWYFRPNDYFGSLTIFLLRHGKRSWNSRFTISWVNDHCYFETNHRQRCRFHTRRR